MSDDKFYKETEFLDWEGYIYPLNIVDYLNGIDDTVYYINTSGVVSTLSFSQKTFGFYKAITAGTYDILSLDCYLDNKIFKFISSTLEYHITTGRDVTIDNSYKTYYYDNGYLNDIDGEIFHKSLYLNDFVTLNKYVYYKKDNMLIKRDIIDKTESSLFDFTDSYFFLAFNCEFKDTFCIIFEKCILWVHNDVIFRKTNRRDLFFPRPGNTDYVIVRNNDIIVATADTLSSEYYYEGGSISYVYNNKLPFIYNDLFIFGDKMTYLKTVKDYYSLSIQDVVSETIPVYIYGSDYLKVSEVPKSYSNGICIDCTSILPNIKDITIESNTGFNRIGIPYNRYKRKKDGVSKSLYYNNLDNTSDMTNIDIIELSAPEFLDNYYIKGTINPSYKYGNLPNFHIIPSLGIFNYKNNVLYNGSVGFFNITKDNVNNIIIGVISSDTSIVYDDPLYYDAIKDGTQDLYQVYQVLINPGYQISEDISYLYHGHFIHTDDWLVSMTVDLQYNSYTYFYKKVNGEFIYHSTIPPALVGVNITYDEVNKIIYKSDYYGNDIDVIRYNSTTDVWFRDEDAPYYNVTSSTTEIERYFEFMGGKLVALDSDTDSIIVINPETFEIEHQGDDFGTVYSNDFGFINLNDQYLLVARYNTIHVYEIGTWTKLGTIVTASGASGTFWKFAYDSSINKLYATNDTSEFFDIYDVDLDQTALVDMIVFNASIQFDTFSTTQASSTVSPIAADNGKFVIGDHVENKVHVFETDSTGDNITKIGELAIPASSNFSYYYDPTDFPDQFGLYLSLRNDELIVGGSQAEQFIYRLDDSISLLTTSDMTISIADCGDDTYPISIDNFNLEFGYVEKQSIKRENYVNSSSKISCNDIVTNNDIRVFKSVDDSTSWVQTYYDTTSLSWEDGTEQMTSDEINISIQPPPGLYRFESDNKNILFPCYDSTAINIPRLNEYIDYDTTTISKYNDVSERIRLYLDGILSYSPSLTKTLGEDQVFGDWIWLNKKYKTLYDIDSTCLVFRQDHSGFRTDQDDFFVVNYTEDYLIINKDLHIQNSVVYYKDEPFYKINTDYIVFYMFQKGNSKYLQINNNVYSIDWNDTNFYSIYYTSPNKNKKFNYFLYNGTGD